MFRLFIIILLTPILGVSQIKNIGTPKIRNFTKSVYKAGTQNWDIAQDENGFMYFANNDGVLQFDGTSWNLIHATSTPVRSVIIDSNNRIFIGFFNDFGELIKSENGEHEFKSLKYLLPKNERIFTEVWRIHEVRQGIVFQCFEYAFILNSEKIEVIHPKKRFMFSYNINGRLFLQEPDVGLFEYFNWSVGEVPWAEELKGKEIWTILQLGDNQLLIGTVGHGFYKYYKGVLSEWKTPASSFIKENKLYSATRLSGSSFAFGTILGGMIICDNEGNIIQQITREKGLLNNTVLSMFADRDDNLWLGLDNGINYLEVNSPMSFITMEDGIGTGYCCCVHKNNLYLGTNQGLFVRPFSGSSQINNQPFQLVENTEGQVWCLKVFDNQLICGHNLGTFVVNQNVAHQISKEPGAWEYLRLNKYPNYLLGGHYNGLALFKNGTKGWEYYKTIEGFKESSRFINEDEDGTFWVSHGTKGVFRVKLDENLDAAIETKVYTEKNGLPDKEHNIVLNIGKGWYVSTYEGLYEYNKQSDSFVKDTVINEVFDLDERITFIESDNQDDLWYIAETELGLIRRNEDFSFTKIAAPFKQLSNKLVNGFEFLYPMNSENIFIGFEDGFAHYSLRIPKSYTKSFSSYITLVELPYLDSVINVTGDKQKSHSFPFRKNSMRFYFTAPFYENPGDLQFSYFLENFSEGWSQWSADTYRDLTNLPEKKYLFKVKAKNIYGVESEVASFEFEIIPPWYRSKVAYYLYVFLIMVLVFLLTSIIQKQFRKAKERERIRHQQELQSKEEELKKQALLTDKEIMKLRNDKLRSEKTYLDKELANQTMSIVQKNKFLMKLNQELKRLQDETLSSSVKTKLVIIKKRIDKEIDNEQQNKVFESYFDEVHTDFFKRLKEKYPQLSPKDLRLSAYIRMNISTKEIATLLNISDRGVEISRYRLRKKMELSRDINLSTFLSNI